MTNIKCNSLVLRQTRTSEFSHYERVLSRPITTGCGTGGTIISRLTESQRNLVVEQLTAGHWDAKVAGYRDGVWLVPVPPAGFYSGIAEFGTATVRYSARRDGEEPFATITVRSPKLAAKQVNIVVYSHDVLGDDATTDADFEIVSINALPFVGEDILQPVTMMRNQLGLVGGTKATYTAEQFAASIRFWSQHAMVDPGEHHNDYGYSR